MSAELLKIVNEGEPGYRAPTAHGTVDVFYRLKRYVFFAPTSGRVAWRGAVAKLILGAHGKSADLVRLDSVPPAGLKRGECKAKQYRIGELKKKGAQVVSKRRPGDPPLAGPAGLALVDTMPAGDARRAIPGWGRRHGCFLVVDGIDGTAYFFRVAYGRKNRRDMRDKIVAAWALNDGPPVEVRGAWPAYWVMARKWTTEERSALAAQRGRDGHRLKRISVETKKKEAARAAKRAAFAAELAARERIKRAAYVVDLAGVALKRAEVAAVRWPDGAGAEKLGGLRARLDKAWGDYLRQVEADRVRVKSKRAIRGPLRHHSTVGLLPRPAWVTLPGSEGDD